MAERAVRTESELRLIVTEARQSKEGPPHLNFTAIFKDGNFRQGSISTEGETPVQARFPQLEIAVEFGWDLKPIPRTELAREVRGLVRALSSALLADARCKEFMREHNFQKRRLD